MDRDRFARLKEPPGPSRIPAVGGDKSGQGTGIEVGKKHGCFEDVDVVGNDYKWAVHGHAS